MTGSELAVVVPDADPDPPSRRRGVAVGWPVAVALAVVANVVVLADVPGARPVAGLFLLFVLPAALLWSGMDRARTATGEALVLALAGTVVIAMVLGLAITTVGHWVGVERPLDPVPVLVGVDIGLLLGAAALLVRRRRFRPAEPAPARRPARPLSAREQLVICVGPLAVLLAVCGAIRLDNGADGTVTVVMLVVATVGFGLLVAWRSQVRRSVVLVTVYLLGLAMLLMTSARGWDITGHDIQREYYVFQLAQQFGSWDVGRFVDAYNACLSITVLPVLVTGLTGLGGLVVFKVVFQLLFALCPVLVWLIARRFGSALVAVLSVIWFVGFPTYFTDMPYICRQEIAFVCLGATLLVVTNLRWSVRRRAGWAVFFSLGTVVSHYSTTYILLALIVFSLLGRWAVWSWWRVRGRSGNPVRQRAVLGPVVFVVVAVLTVLWTGPVTGTGGHLEQTAVGVFSSLTGAKDGARSAETGYALFPPPQPPPDQLLADYDAQVRADTAADRANGRYLPASVLDRYPVTLKTSADLPLTPIGSALTSAGIDVSLLNTALRQGAARLLQLLVVVGLAAVLLRRARGLRGDLEFVLLAGASLVVLALQVLLPSISVEYGVLRAFQQALFLLAPFVAVGTTTAVAWLGRLRPRGHWPQRVAVAIALVFYLSLTGVIPQVLGGYPAQLQLNNTGTEHDLYMIDPQKTVAVLWITTRLDREGGGEVAVGVPGDRYTYTLTYDHPAVTVSSIYPALLRPWSYVLLHDREQGEPVESIRQGSSTVTYSYPTAVLDETKNRIYSSADTAIYR